MPANAEARDPVGRRRLRAHATSARDRAWRRALPKTQSDDRAGVRQHEIQPPDRPLPPPRKIRRAFGMAPDHRHPQPSEAPQAPNRRCSRLTEARGTGRRGAAPSLAYGIAAGAARATTPHLRNSHDEQQHSRPTRAAVLLSPRGVAAARSMTEPARDDCNRSLSARAAVIPIDLPRPDRSMPFRCSGGCRACACRS